MSDTRGRIIDALEEVLAESGPAGTTLEAVAARAGVSKGGLLYHYGSKEALFGGLLDRLRTLGEADATDRGTGDVIASYLETSSVAQDEFTRTLMAALRLVGATDLDVEGAIMEAIDHWSGVLRREVEDPLLARLIVLVGDGLYLRALLGGAPDPVDGRLAEFLHGLVGRSR